MRHIRRLFARRKGDSVSQQQPVFQMLAFGSRGARLHVKIQVPRLRQASSRRPPWFHAAAFHIEQGRQRIRSSSDIFRGKAYDVGDAAGERMTSWRGYGGRRHAPHRPRRHLRAEWTIYQDIRHA